jgi:epoxyqueuosine reductase
MILTSGIIRQKAIELGFTNVGFSRAQPVNNPEHLASWLEAGHQASMQWMGKNPAKRQDPRQILPEAVSLISLGLNYYTPVPQPADPFCGIISRYARGADYHEVFMGKLKQLAAWIHQQMPEAKTLEYCDTGPVMEKSWSQTGGIGWIGKHSNLISQNYGSWLFLGEILVNLPLDYDQESSRHCGRCTRCLASCPTAAIVAPHVVDARRCISYLTIEHRGPIPRPLRPLMGNLIFGCDICQDVCPWNRFAQSTPETAFQPLPGLIAPKLTELMEISEEDFKHRFQHSPIQRARYPGFLRNVAVALGNCAHPDALPTLTRQSRHANPLVRGHVAWALSKINSGDGQIYLEEWMKNEKDPYVMEEIAAARQGAKS